MSNTILKNMTTTMQRATMNGNVSDDEYDPLNDTYSDGDWSEYEEYETETGNDVLAPSDDDVDYEEKLLADLEEEMDTLNQVSKQPLVMPSIDEMNHAFDVFCLEKQAVRIIEEYVIDWLHARRLKEKQLSEQEKRDEVAAKTMRVREWKKYRGHRGGISQLMPLEIQSRNRLQEYDQMCFQMMLMEHVKKATAAFWQRLQFKKDLDRKKKAAALEQRIRRVKRARAKRGLNKNSAWHKERASGALAIAGSKKSQGTVPVPAKKGTADQLGRRAERRKKLEKRIKKAKEEPTVHTSPVASNTVVVLPPPPGIDDLPDLVSGSSGASCTGSSSESVTDEPVVKKEEEKVDDMEQYRYMDMPPLEIPLPSPSSDDPSQTQETDFDDFITVMGRNSGIIKRGNDRIAAGKTFTLSGAGPLTCKRSNAFALLADKHQQAETLKFTKMCRSVLMNKRCYHKKCRFAHSVDQLQKRVCRFGDSCRFVVPLGNGEYRNVSRKVCGYYHSTETVAGFCRRMGFPLPKRLQVSEAKRRCKRFVPPTEAAFGPSLCKHHIPSVANDTGKPEQRWSNIVIKSLTVNEDTDADIPNPDELPVFTVPSSQTRVAKRSILRSGILKFKLHLMA